MNAKDDPVQYYTDAFRRYGHFRGRARRREYWYFILFHILASMAANLLDTVFGTMNFQRGIGLLGSIYFVASLLPALAIAARRLQDTGRSPWWLLLLVIAPIGPLILLVMTLFDSQPGENRYGANPKGADTSAG